MAGSPRPGKKNKKVTDEVYQKITDLIQKDGSELPAVIALNCPDIAYDVWALWVATGRRFLPSQLLEEREDLLSDVITLDGVYEALKEKYNADSNG